MQPLAIGTIYDGRKIVEVVEYDPDDDYQPFLYKLDNGTAVWIPEGEEEERNERPQTYNEAMAEEYGPPTIQPDGSLDY